MAKTPNTTEQEKITQDVQSFPLRAQFNRGDSRITYDFKNNEFIAVSESQNDACTLQHLKIDGADSMTVTDHKEVLEMTDTSRRLKTLDMLIQSNASNSNASLNDALERTKHQLKKRTEAEAEKKMPHLHYFADTWNILRFLKGNTSSGVKFSPNGLNLSITHKDKGQDRQREDELVLTNMSFTSGLHYWEIIASIGCNNIQVGVHNPITKSEVMVSFKTKSKRVITVCLDLHEGVLKFWLNDNFMQKKVTKLFPVGGPWVPCVKIGKERNCLTLNPFANAPTHFGEANQDRGCQLDTILMPLLTNFVCVTGLPSIEAKSQSETLKILNQIFQHSNNQISDIHMPAPGSKVMFCFIKFHHYSYMAEFLEKHRPAGKFKIYEAHEIFDWFVKGEPSSEDLEQPFALIKKAIALPLKNLSSALSSISEAHIKLNENIEQVVGQSPKNGSSQVSIGVQVYSDKLIVSKGQTNQVKAVSRSPATQEFNLQDVCFGEDNQSLNSLIQLSVNRHLMLQLIETIPWGRLFKQSLADGYDPESLEFSSQTAYHGLFFQFFNCMACQFKDQDENRKFYAPIFATKLVLDSLMLSLQREIKVWQKGKQAESPQVIVNSLKFSKQERSIDELKQLVSMISDMQEQLWAKTRSEQCLPEVKYLCQTISRPQSALNRLGSFVQWPFAEGISPNHSASPFDLAENGFYLKSTEMASTVYNPLLELSDFTPENFSLQKTDTNRRDKLGYKNACFSALPSQNIPLYKSLNYLAPQKFTTVSEVFCSQNNGFVLVGGLNGSVSICSSQISLTPIKTLQFFSHDVPKKKQKYLEVYQKLEARNTACIEYQGAICKKESQLPFIQDQIKRRSKTLPKKKKGKSVSKVKNSLSPPTLKIPKKNSSKKPSKSLSTLGSKKLDEKAKSAMPQKSIIEEFKDNVEKIALRKVAKQAVAVEKQKAKQEAKIEPGEQRLTEEKIISIDKEQVDASDAHAKPIGRQRTNSSSIHVLGYTMLSKEGVSIDPLMIGCVYRSHQDESEGKYFIKLRRLMYQISYILNFIHGSQLNGNMTNLASGTQTLQRKMNKDQLEGILRHREVLNDLVPIFVRTQVTKKKYPQWESKFPTMMLSETNEEELELQNVDHVIDFTNVVYSVTNQSHIHILGVEKDKRVLLQLRVDHYFSQGENFVGKIKLFETSRFTVPDDALRVFQVEDQVIVLSSTKMLIFDLATMSYVREIQLITKQTPQLAEKAQVCNQTEKEEIYTAKNILKFKELGHVPQQQWVLCLTNETNQITKYKLVLSEANQEDQDKCSVKDAIMGAFSSEIEQIPSLLKAHKTGLRLIDYPKSTFASNFAILDTQQNLYSSIFFKKIAESTEVSPFTVAVGSCAEASRFVKKFYLEFSFKRLASTNLNAPQVESKLDQPNWMNLNQTIMRLPLQVEHLKGNKHGDTVYPSQLTQPDNQVFVSNYPEPEFIFKHEEGKRLIITQITLWSKISKESQCGFPIGKGFIFFADSVADLMDSVQMRKAISELESNNDKRTSGEVHGTDYDALYFDFGDQERLTIDLSFYKPCRFFKVIPTGFRSSPINYADCQDFTKDQAELMFFGASGYIEEGLAEMPPAEDHQLCFNPDRKVKIDVEVFNESKEIATADNLMITQFRSSSQTKSLETIPSCSSAYQVGLATIPLTFMPDELNSKCLTFKVREDLKQEWELSGISVQVETTCPDFQTFRSDGMRDKANTITKTLIQEDMETPLPQPCPEFEEFVKALIDVIEGIDVHSDSKRTQALLCLSKLIFDNSLMSETQRSNLILVIQSNLNVEILFKFTNFIEKSSVEFQKHFINLIDLAGLKRKPTTRRATNLLIIQVVQELSLVGGVAQQTTPNGKRAIVDSRYFFSIDTLKNILNLVSRKRRPYVVSKFTELIFNELEGALHHDPDYFKLRSELDINAFPFDIDYLSLDQFDPLEVTKAGEESSLLKRQYALPCDFQLIKINSSYMIKASLKDTSTIEKVRLHFRMNNSKCIHKFRVSILQHNPDESPLLLFVRTYDESMFAGLTRYECDENSRKKKKEDEAQQPNLDDYFDILTSCDRDGQIKVNNERLDKAQDLPFTYGSPFTSEYEPVVQNRLTCQLDSANNGKQFEVQVELLDTYRTINKATAFSQVLITPEFFGSPTPQKSNTQEEIKPLNQDLEELQNVGESLSLSVPNLDLKNRQKSTKDAVITKQTKKQPFISSKCIPSNFINKVAIGDLTYEVFTGLATQKTMKCMQNNFIFKHVAQTSKLAKLGESEEKKDTDQAEQSLQEAADNLLAAQNQLREQLQLEHTVKESKSGMARIANSVAQISKLKKELRVARANLPIDRDFLKGEINLKNKPCDDKVERVGYRRFGYQTFSSQTDASVWFQLHQKNNSGSLKYTFALTELICTYLQQVYVREPQLIKEPDRLYKALFRVFIAQETKGAHPIVEELLRSIYKGFKEDEERSKMMFDLIQEILIKPSCIFNYGNFLDYIQSDRVNFIGVNEILQQLTEIFQCQLIVEEKDAKVNSEESAIMFLQDKLQTQQRLRKKATLICLIDGTTASSSSSMVIAALSFLLQQITYRVRLCTEYRVKSGLDSVQLKRQMHLDSPQLMQRIQLSSLSRFGAWQILNNNKFGCGQCQAKSTAFLHCFVEAFLNLTKLNLEPLGQSTAGQSLVVEEWLIILMAVAQSGQTQIQESFVQAVINLMIASKYQVQKEIVQVFNYCLAYLLAQDISLSQRIYQTAQAQNKGGFSLLFSHYQSLVRIQTKVLNVISARINQPMGRKQLSSFKKKANSSQPLTMTKQLSIEFLEQIKIQNQKLGDFIKKLLTNLNLIDDLSFSANIASPSPSAFSQITRQVPNSVDPQRATSVLVEIYQSLTFLKDSEARQQVTQAIVKQLGQLTGASQIDFSKSVLMTSEQLICTPEQMKVNARIILSLIKMVIEEKLIENDGNNLKFFQVFCRNLIGLLLTGSSSKQLPKRTDSQKQESMFRKDSASTYLKPSQILKLLSLLARYVNTRCNYSCNDGNHEICTELLDFSIANKLCELCLYSKHHNYLPEELMNKKPDFVLEQVDLSLDKSQTIGYINDILEFLVRNKFEGQSATKSSSFKPIAKLNMLCTKLSNIVIVIGKSRNNAMKCLPMLMDLLSSMDSQILSLVKDKKILDLRGIQLQQNANDLFMKMLVNWIESTQGNDEVSYKFMHELNGFEFIINRLSNGNSQNQAEIDEDLPCFIEQLEKSKSNKPDTQEVIKEESGEESSDNDTQAANLMKFVGQKLGMTLVKKSVSTKVLPKELDLANRRDTELLADAKVKLFLKKQPVMYKKKEEKTALGEFKKKGGSDQGQFEVYDGSDPIGKESRFKEQLVEKNYANSMKLVDCTEGDEITTDRSTLKWDFTTPNSKAVQLVIGTNEERKQEYQMTFDLGEVVQFTEIMVTLEGRGKNKANPFGRQSKQSKVSTNSQSEYPYAIIIEGKSSAPFAKQKKQSPTFTSSATKDVVEDRNQSTTSVDAFLACPAEPEIINKMGVGSHINLSTQDEDKLLEQIKELSMGNFDFPDWSIQLNQNPNKRKEFCISQIAKLADESTRHEAQHIRFRFVFSDPILCTTASPSIGQDKYDNPFTPMAGTTSQKVINLLKISVMAVKCLDEKDVMVELAQMKRKNAMNCLAEYFTTAPKTVLTKITENSNLQRSFINSFDALEPFLLLNSSVIMPIFIQMAAMSEEICNELILSKILLDYPLFTVKNHQTETESTVETNKQVRSQIENQLEVMLNLLEGLVMAKPENQVSCLATVLQFVLNQTEFHATNSNLSNTNLHINFIIGVANLFVDCASLIAKELTYTQTKTEQVQKEVTLTVTNRDIETVLEIIPRVANQTQQRSLTLFTIFLLQLPSPLKSSGVDIKTFVETRLLPKVQNLTIESISSCEIISLLLANQPSQLDSLLTEASFLDQILKVLQEKAQGNECGFSDDQCVDLVHIVYNCIGSGCMNVQTKSGLTTMQMIAVEFYNLLRPQKKDDKVSIAADKFKLHLTQAMSKCLLQMINYDMQTTSENKALDKIIKEIHNDILLVQEQPEQKKKGAKKTENTFVSLVFEPLLKLRVTVPVAVSALTGEHDGKVRIKQQYKQENTDKGQNLLPTDLLTKENVDMFMKALKQQNSAHKLNLKEGMFNNPWQKLIDVEPSSGSSLNAEEMMSKIKDRSNLLYLLSLKLDKNQNSENFTESESDTVQMCFFCPNSLEDLSDDLFGDQRTILEPSPKDNKGAFFFACGPPHIGNAVFIASQNCNNHTDFTILDIDKQSRGYMHYMMNNVVVTWEDKIQPDQMIYFNVNENYFQGEDDNFKNVIKSLNHKAGPLQRFSVFHYNEPETRVKKGTSRDIGVPRYQLVSPLTKDKKVKNDDGPKEMVDQFSPISILKQNLVMQIPVDCKLATLAKLLGIHSQAKFVDIKQPPSDGLFGSKLDESMKVGQLSHGTEILELFTQIPTKKELIVDQEKTPQTDSKRIFKKLEVKVEKAKAVTATATEPKEQEYELTVFDKYLNLGGSQQMLEIAVNTVNQYRNRNVFSLLSTFLKDLKMFSILPGFSDLFFKPTDKKELLLNLIKRDFADIDLPKKKKKDGEYKKALKEFDGLKRQVQKYTAEAYEVIETLINQKDKSDSIEETLKLFINSGLMQNLLQSISTMSGEFSRRKVTGESTITETKSEEEKQEAELSIEDSQEESSDESYSPVMTTKKKVMVAVDQADLEMINTDDSGEWQDQEIIKKAMYDLKTDEQKETKNVKAKKGIGYTTGVGEAWDVKAYLELKESKNASLLRVFRIIEKFLQNLLKMEDGIEAVYEKMRGDIIESAVLPTIESALRSGSLLEMAKEMELYQTYIQFIEKLASIPTLFDLILELPEEYEPKQRDSILSLLQKNRGLSEVFLACLDQNENTQKISKSDTDEVKNPKKLAILFVDVATQLSKIAQQKAQMKQQRTIESLLALPIDKQYITLLEDQRFNYFSFRQGKKATEQMSHFFGKEEKNAKNPPTKKLIRLAQEIADLTNSLPVEYTSAIFCRVDKKRVDFMKCLIMGATGTPYANGAFTFDIFFDNKYPDGPPKVQLTTTGGGQVRFNPNLYACGKVCLSLLGTWRGSSTENWDPKVSTTLQVLMSIQAIIMSNEVYFNEPGYEQEAGTIDGEKRNTAYSNIIRYATAKYAILDHLETPTKGFEQAIHRSFFVKKQFILEELDGWIKEAEKDSASYASLVLDHNYNLGQKFQAEGEYLSSLKGTRDEIKKAFENLKLESNGQVSYKGKVHTSDQAEEKTISATGVDQTTKIEEVKDYQKALDLVDVSYDNKQSQGGGTIDVDDEKVKDRWSRYIGAMGIEAVAKQAESTVFVSGLGPLGVEIAKNIILAGCKELILHDNCTPVAEDLDGQFFIERKDVNSDQTRAQLCQMKIQELNSFVKVTLLPKSTDLAEFFGGENCKVKVAVFTDTYAQGIKSETLAIINEKCRTRTQMIIADNSGLFARVITDFGPSHTVIDQNGEPNQESMVEKIEAQENNALVTLIQGAVHGLQDGDVIELTEVKGMKKVDSDEEIIDTTSKTTKSNDSVNGTRFKVLSVLTKSTFIIDCDLRKFTKFERDGIVKQIKTPMVMEFQPLRNILESKSDSLLDFGFFLDFTKLFTFRVTGMCYKVHNVEMTSDQFIQQVCSQFEGEEASDAKNIAEIFWKTAKFNIAPISAFIGGVVAQEVVKGITQKFTPIKQEFYYDAIELYDEASKEEHPTYKSLYACLGKDLVDKIFGTKLFMIGAGAIGCELLKNFAMLGLGSGEKGLITMTDPDVIEVSNLNRQFLFREKHVRKPKSMTAAAASIQMNPDLKGHIDARLDKVHADTVSIYSEEFFKSQAVVANALDNIQARLFIDAKCVSSRVPLLDSGTLGPKGHVQVIIPFKTESYASQQDPEENTAIPHCTLKMFPEETLHCVEWAKDIFGTLFSLNPQNFNKLKTTDINDIEFSQSTEFKNIKQVIKMASSRPETFVDCVRLARQKFQKYFHDSILQLLHVYPLDKTLQDGRLFWTLPKRPPTAQMFDQETTKNNLHRDFIAAFACLTAKVYGIQVPHNPRSIEAKEAMARQATQFEVKPFVSNDQKANAIESQVDKQNQKEEDKQDAPEEQSTFNPAHLREQFEKQVLCPDLKEFTMQCEEFEKDNDANFHIDFIHACANIRALNYGLKEMDWLTVKLKAGRIVPALATTTAAIAGLQTIELLKVIKAGSLKLEHFKNTYLNLAVPSMMSSEPGAPEKTKIRDGLETDLWDRWAVQIQKETTMGVVLNDLQKRYKLSARDIIFNSTPLFMHALRDKALPLEKQPALKKTVIELLSEANEGKSEVLANPGDTVDLTITFVIDQTTEDQEIILQNIPIVRLTLM